MFPTQWILRTPSVVVLVFNFSYNGSSHGSPDLIYHPPVTTASVGRNAAILSRVCQTGRSANAGGTPPRCCTSRCRDLHTDRSHRRLAVVPCNKAENHRQLCSRLQQHRRACGNPIWYHRYQYAGRTDRCYCRFDVGDVAGAGTAYRERNTWIEPATGLGGRQPNCWAPMSLAKRSALLAWGVLARLSRNERPDFGCP